MGQFIFLQGIKTAYSKHCCEGFLEKTKSHIDLYLVSIKGSSLTESCISHIQFPSESIVIDITRHLSFLAFFFLLHRLVEIWTSKLILLLLMIDIQTNYYYCPVGWGCRIHRLLLCRRVRIPQRVSWIGD